MRKSHVKPVSLLIVGAGPTGLAAALYAAREGFKPVVIDKSIAGGMAAITDRIDNYPGFEEGVGGLELTDHLYAHAVRFGADVQTGVSLTGLTSADGVITAQTSTGEILAESVLIATGSTYKRLQVPGEADYIGRGVHFCATCDAPLYRGKDVIVVGGGNSAIQESLFIARFAKYVTMLVRGPQLGGTQILREQLEALKNVKYQFNAQVKEIRGDGTKVTGVHVINSENGEALDMRTDAVFVFIGLNANTSELAGHVDLDESGFVVTRPDFSTNMKGVFAAGDVRSGSTWQIASAIGEGVSATLAIRAYLDRKHHLERKAMTDVRRRAATA